MKNLPVLIFLFSFIFISACNVANHKGDEVSLKLEKKFEAVDYLSSQQMTFTITNSTNATVEYDFPTGCQFGYTVTYKEELIVDSSKALACIQAITRLELSPNTSKIFTFDLYVPDHVEELSKGTYQVSAFLLEGYTGETTTTFELE